MSYFGSGSVSGSFSKRRAYHAHDGMVYNRAELMKMQENDDKRNDIGLDYATTHAMVVKAKYPRVQEEQVSFATLIEATHGDPQCKIYDYHDKMISIMEAEEEKLRTLEIARILGNYKHTQTVKTAIKGKAKRKDTKNMGKHKRKRSIYSSKNTSDEDTIHTPGAIYDLKGRPIGIQQNHSTTRRSKTMDMRSYGNNISSQPRTIHQQRRNAVEDPDID